nr:hypothetical protein [Tanacetum cinerariifolium]
EWEDDGMACDDHEGPLVFDDDQYEKEIVSGDVGENLMVRPGGDNTGPVSKGVASSGLKFFD